MTVLANGKVAITTPDDLRPEQMARVSDIVREWLDGDQEVLIIGNCHVVVANVIE